MIGLTVTPPATIQNYIDLAYEGGGGTVILEAGTYTLDADLILKSGVELKGASRDNVIIDCNSSYSVKLNGTDVYSTGTVTINLGDTTLVGSGTTWTADMIGRSVWLDGFWYLITDFTSDTSLEIESYEGVNLAGANYVLALINNNSTMTTLTIQNSTGVAIDINYSNNPNLNDLSIFDSGTGINMDYVLYPQLLVFDAYNGTNLDMNFVEGLYANFSDFSYSTVSHGIVGTNVTTSLITNTNVFNNTGSGIYLTDSTNNNINILGLSGNGANGITLYSGCNKNMITNVGLYDNTTYGINIVDATSNDTIILGNIFSGNGTAATNDSGTGTLIRSNIGVLDN